MNLHFIKQWREIMTRPASILFLLAASLLLSGCGNSDYEGLKDDFSIKKIYYLDSVDRYTVGNCGVSLIYTIDLKQESLSHKQLLIGDSFVQKEVYPTAAKKNTK